MLYQLSIMSLLRLQIFYLEHRLVETPGSNVSTVRGMNECAVQAITSLNMCKYTSFLKILIGSELTLRIETMTFTLQLYIL